MRRVPTWPWFCFALACSCGEPGSPPAVEPSLAGAVPTTDPARQRILEFWRMYQEATRMRVAGNDAAALVRYDSALALNPDHGDALYYSGNAAFTQGEYTEAESRWRRLLAVDGSNARAHVQLGVLYSCGLPGAPVDLQRARQELERALALNRAETGPQVRLGEIALLQGDEDDAARYLNGARQTNERSVAAHYLSGYLHWRAGRVEAAREALRSVAAVRGQHVDASVSAEGQTRRGFRPLLEGGQDGPLASHWQGRTPGTAVHTEYERFSRALGSLREQFASRQPTKDEDQ